MWKWILDKRLEQVSDEKDDDTSKIYSRAFAIAPGSADVTESSVKDTPASSFSLLSSSSSNCPPKL